MTHSAPDVFIAIMEAHKEFANRANESVVAAQVHVELVVAREVPPAAIAVHHMHHGDVAQLHSTRTGFRSSAQASPATNDSFNNVAAQPTLCPLQDSDIKNSIDTP